MAGKNRDKITAAERRGYGMAFGGVDVDTVVAGGGNPYTSDGERMAWERGYRRAIETQRGRTHTPFEMFHGGRLQLGDPKKSRHTYDISAVATGGATGKVIVYADDATQAQNLVRAAELSPFSVSMR